MAQSVEFLASASRLYLANARALVTTAAVMMVPFGVVSFVSGLVSERMLAAGAPSAAVLAGKAMLFIFGIVVSNVTGAALTVAVNAAATGGTAEWRGAWRAALERAWPLIATCLAFLPRAMLWMLAAGVPVGILFVVVAAVSDEPPPALLMMGVLIPLLAVVWSRYALVATVPVLEDLRGGAAVDRAVDLLRGRRIVAVVTFGLIMLVPMVLGFFLGKFASNGSEASGLEGDPVSAAIGGMMQILLLPLSTAVAVLLYRRALADRPVGTPVDPTSG